MSEETGNLVVKVDMKENEEEGPMMVNIEVLEAWVSSGKANGVIRVASGLLGLVRVSRAILMDYCPN
jgi:hypothetical protein